jgi:3-deoxy-manno-octulosonate cytidylyltransferase (CMP-KDO synthetase)
MKLAIIIPARYNSSRLPGKPLIKINKIPILIRTYLQCAKAISPKVIYVATDHIKIKKECDKWGVKVVMTSKNCLTGTDRVFEASKKIKADIFINVQGDEPILNPNDLKLLIKQSKKYPNEIISGYCKISRKEDFKSVSIPKIIKSEKEYLIYASRAPVPFNKNKKFVKAWKQVCIYAFPKKYLKIFYNQKKKTPIEAIEDIEYLRFLELGYRIKTLKMSSKSIAVDTKKDLKKVKKIISLKK